MFYSLIQRIDTVGGCLPVQNHEYSLDVSLALEMTSVNCSLTQHNGTHDTVFNYAYFLERMEHKSKELLLLQNKDH